MALPTVFLTVAYAGLVRRAPLAVCTPMLALAAYAHYMLMHEAIHGNIVTRPRRMRWINPLVGWIGSVALGGSWPLLRRTHLLHHAHTNGDGDPDVYWKGSLSRLFGKWAKAVPGSFIPLIALRLTKPERLQRMRGVLSDTDVLIPRPSR